MNIWNGQCRVWERELIKIRQISFEWYWARHPVEGGDYKFAMTVICMVVTWFRNGKIQMARWVYSYKFAGEWIVDPRGAEGWCCAPADWDTGHRRPSSARGEGKSQVFPQLLLVPLWPAKSRWQSFLGVFTLACCLPPLEQKCSCSELWCWVHLPVGTF